MLPIRFEARRIVLKEGHAASCYYIILSGVCLVNQLDFDRRNNSQFVTTVKEIGPGDCFGVSSNQLIEICTAPL